MLSELQDLRVALENYAAVDLGALDFTELETVMTEIQRLRSVTEAAALRTTAAFDTNRGWATQGHRSPVGWLRDRCHHSTPAAGRHLAAARAITTMPHSYAALVEGRITPAHLSRLARARHDDHHDRRDHFGADEELLVNWAATLCWDDFAMVLAEWEIAVDPEAANDTAASRTERRALSASKTLDGMVRIDGWLDPVAGEEFLTELHRLHVQLAEDDWTAARATNPNATVADLTRTPRQRRADALTLMANRSAVHDDQPTGAGPSRWVINLTMDYQTWINELNATATNRPPDTHPSRWTCHLPDGTTLTPSQALPIMLAAQVRRVVIAPDGHILDYGRKRRFFTRALRGAIELRDRHCTWPGCHQPPWRCHTDHITEWEDHGHTSQANGQLLCPYHNRFKHHTKRRRE